MADLNAAIRLDEKHSSGYANRGLLYEAKEDLAQALTDFEAAKKLVPRNREAVKGAERVKQQLAAKPETKTPQNEAASAASPSPSAMAKPTEMTPQPKPAAPGEQSVSAQPGGPTRPEIKPLPRQPPAEPSVPQSSLAGAGQRLALLIGNAKYSDNDAPLKYLINDARELGDVLRRLGFDFEIKYDLPKLELNRTLQSFYDKVRPGATALVYFGGFGIQVDRQSYVLPVDALIYNERDVIKDGVNINSVLSELDMRQAALKVAVIDASRRNPFERRLQRQASIGLAPITGKPGTLVMLSAAPDQVIDDEDGESSLFMRTLLKEIGEPGSTVEQAFGRTRNAIARATKGRQTPWMSNLGEDFLLKPNRSQTVQ